MKFTSNRSGRDFSHVLVALANANRQPTVIEGQSARASTESATALKKGSLTTNTTSEANEDGVLTRSSAAYDPNSLEGLRVEVREGRTGNESAYERESLRSAGAGTNKGRKY